MAAPEPVIVRHLRRLFRACARAPAHPPAVGPAAGAPRHGACRRRRRQPITEEEPAGALRIAYRAEWKSMEVVRRLAPLLPDHSDGRPSPRLRSSRNCRQAALAGAEECVRISIALRSCKSSLPPNCSVFGISSSLSASAGAFPAACITLGVTPLSLIALPSGP